MRDKTIFVISDLHMGDGGPRDNFQVGNREKELESFLRYVEKEHGKLIILGDLFEFWQASIARILVKRKAWLERFADLRVTYVIGNHDIDLAAFVRDDGSVNKDFLIHPFFDRITKSFKRPIADKEFKFMHGHEVDEFNKDENPGWGRMFTILAGMIEDINKSPLLQDGDTVEKVLSKFGEAMLGLWDLIKQKVLKKNYSNEEPERQLTPAQNPKRKDEMIKKYLEDKEKEGYEIAIVGHTHEAGQREDWYYNSGCWAAEKNSFVKISTNGKVEVFDWVNGKAILNETEL